MAPPAPDAIPAAESAPLCAAPDAATTPPARPLPKGAWDCHAHICGPAREFAYAADRIYTPPDALLPNYLTMLATLGVARAVLVQPSVYGTDNTVLERALAALGPDARGVCVVEDSVADSELERLHALGVRGLRLNLVDVADPAGGLPLDRTRALAERVKPLGWHVEFLVHVDEVPDLDRRFADFPTDVVFGHLGYVRLGRGPEDPGFRALLRLLETGRAWVKLTGPYRISAGGPPYAEAEPFARALFETAPERLVWGSDWPHVMVKGEMPNDGALCDILRGWAGDDGLLEKVLVENPSVLYGLGTAEGKTS